jgi:hypothetical protein
MDQVIICKFHKWEYFDLIVLIVIYVEVKVMFKNLVLAFHLTIYLLVIGSTQLVLHFYVVA